MAALLARREAEGLSLRAIAEDAGIPFGTLSWWSWRLRQDPTPAVDAEGGFVELVATGNRRVKPTWKPSATTPWLWDATTRANGCAACAA